MEEKLYPNKFNTQINELCQQALEEAKQLLLSNPKGHYIHFPDWDDEFEAQNTDGVVISVKGVGINENGELCILAVVDNIGYGFSGDEYPACWTELKKFPIRANAYPNLYRFVADNMDEATPEPKNEEEDE